MFPQPRPITSSPFHHNNIIPLRFILYNITADASGYLHMYIMLLSVPSGYKAIRLGQPKKKYYFPSCMRVFTNDRILEHAPRAHTRTWWRMPDGGRSLRRKRPTQKWRKISKSVSTSADIVHGLQDDVRIIPSWQLTIHAPTCLTCPKGCCSCWATWLRYRVEFVRVKEEKKTRERRYYIILCWKREPYRLKSDESPCSR